MVLQLPHTTNAKSDYTQTPPRTLLFVFTKLVYMFLTFSPPPVCQNLSSDSIAKNREKQRFYQSCVYSCEKNK